MNQHQIKNVNQCIIVLRHFIEVSSKILPTFADLEFKKHLNEEEELQRLKIIEVYNANSFDEQISVFLMNSTILSCIKKLYLSILQGDKRGAILMLKRFNDEYGQLKKSWEVQMVN
jgi:hypothetical protein